MAKPYHIKLKRTAKNLDDTNIQNYTDLKWGEPIITDDGYMAVGNKTGNADDNGDYQSGAVSTLKVFKSVAQSLKDKFVFWKTGTSTISTGVHVTLTDESGNNILPDTDAKYVKYGDSNVEDSIAPLDSPALSGTPTAPDIGSASTSSQVATKNYVESSISGTTNYLAKFTNSHTVGNLVAINASGSDGKFLNEKGVWATIPLSASGTRGGIQIGYSESGTNYAVKLSSEKAYVSVPWTDTKVTQTNTTGNADYRVLFSENANDTTQTVGARKNTSFKYNPSTTTLTVPNATVTSVTSTNATITNVTATNINGVAVSSSPKFTDTNTAVTQTATTTDATYEVLFSGTADNTTRTEGARKTNTLTYNPSTKVLSTTSISATNLNGVAIGSSPKFTDTNNAVTQTATTTNAAYEVLFSVTADNNTRTEGARKNSNLKFNPSTGTLTTTVVSATTGTFTTLTKGGVAVATETYVNNAVQGITPFTYVTTLPTTGISKSTIYVLATSVTSGSTTYTEYVPYVRVTLSGTDTWVPLSGTW